VIAHPSRLNEHFLEGRDLGAQLVEFDGRRELVRRLISCGVVEIVFALLDVA
jgi:hypothetical protein